MISQELRRLEFKPMSLGAHFEDTMVVVTRRINAHQRLQKESKFVQGKQQLRVSGRIRDRVAIAKIEGVDAISLSASWFPHGRLGRLHAQSTSRTPKA